MKPLLIFVALFLSLVSAEPYGFINPLDYDHSDAQRNALIAYIQQDVQRLYCGSEMRACHPMILQIAQMENLEAFQTLAHAKDKKILSCLVKTYCDNSAENCNYSDLKTLYEEKFWCNVVLKELRSTAT